MSDTPRQNKALQNGAGTSFGAGAVIGTPLGVLGAWVLTLNGIEVPVEVASAMGSLCNGLLTLAATKIFSDS